VSLKRKGIILAGGSGSRLSPLTAITSKQLLPVYNKPMIYYPISTLMLADIRDILIISDTDNMLMYEKLLGDGSRFGIRISYETQAEPRGVAEALIIGEDFIGEDSFALILGDNLIYGDSLGEKISSCFEQLGSATIFGYHVSDPSRFGVVELGADNNVIGLEEKPLNPKSNYAAIGLYVYPACAVKIAKNLELSSRNELEITDVNLNFLASSKLEVSLLGRGYAWFDMGTHTALLDAANFIKMIEDRTSTNIACLEEIAYRSGWIAKNQIIANLKGAGDSEYYRYIHITCLT
jgi:glucose-1-phosphate thymidylyltransferase